MDFLQDLNPRQRQAVEHTDGPLLILAGAGSGKTRVITYRIAHLIRNRGVAAQALLAVTFTNKAAGEMRDRVAVLVKGASSPPWVSTFHAFCVRLLRMHGASLSQIRPGFTTQFSIYDEADQLSIVKAVFRQLGLDEKFLSHEAALGKIGDAKNRRITPADYQRDARDPKSGKMAVVYDYYEQALRRANALDFDDLLLEAVRLLRHDEAVRRRMVERFRYILVDEYQDTNRSQYELVRLLTGPERNICVVGDEDQSIYGWRGADIRNILDFERDYPGAELIRLEQNYRSTKNILEAASHLVAHNLERKGKTLWTEADAGAPILFYRGRDSEKEALFIAEYVEKYLGRNRADRVAILYRTNFQSRAIEEALRRYRRKYLLVGGLSFYQRAEVKDMLAYLKAAASPQDASSLLRIINRPARGIGKSTVEQIEQRAQELRAPLWDAIEDLLAHGGLATRAQAALEAFQDLMNRVREQVQMQPLHQALAWIKQQTGYQRMLEQEETLEGESRLENIDELINAAADAVERGETLREFLDHAALVAETDQLDEAAQVTLLTLHSAKGLEFQLVIMAGLEEGLFPHSRSLASEAGLEEERRLCYVGLTRARKQLVLTWARERRRYGGGEFVASTQSRFLREIPRKLVEDLSPPASRAEKAEAAMDLWAERQVVREMARRNTFTGKTYNSVENIAEFFTARKVPVSPPKARPPAAPPPRPPAARRGYRAGARVHHPKYGAGTILRREGDGEDAKLTISFPGHGVKKLIEKYTTLRQE
jgi:DNA helicase-2/ATP-dependent DNA helicase PcrA